LNAQEISQNIFADKTTRETKGFMRLPIKQLQYNRAPAVAPLGVLEQNDGWAKIGLDKDTVTKHRDILLSNPSFAENVRSALENKKEYEKGVDPEAMLYDGFVPDEDKIRIEKVRLLDEKGLADLHPNFIDERLPELLLHYKARNFPRSLSEEETEIWEKWRGARIMSTLPRYIESLQKLAVEKTDDKSQFILQELQLWAESIAPADLD
jgi:exodeoxyribonuclease-1